MKQYTQLTEGERNQIYALNKQGFTDTAIAKLLKRSQSTVSRELERNKGGRGYRPKQAQRLTDKRRSNASSRTRIPDSVKAYMLDKLVNDQWSPEQISGRIFIDLGEKVSHEWIYQYIYNDRKNGGELHKHLRHGKKQRKRRCNPAQNRAGRGHIVNRRDIDERPSYVDDRLAFGDWEIDTIIGKGHCGAAVTIVERKSRFAILIPLQNRKADIVATETINVLEPIKNTVKSITADNGKEFAHHELVSKKLDLNYYFAKPYHSWERGTNENSNGLIRQYIPKHASILDVTTLDAQLIMDKLNNRPRKTLDYQTPAEVFLEHTDILPSLQ